MAQWGFLTNHALVLIHVANYPRSTLREIANAVGITERATLSILRLLEADGIISRQREGRRNRYWLEIEALLHYELKEAYSVVELAKDLMAMSRRLQRAAVG